MSDFFLYSVGSLLAEIYIALHKVSAIFFFVISSLLNILG